MTEDLFHQCLFAEYDSALRSTKQLVTAEKHHIGTCSNAVLRLRLAGYAVTGEVPQRTGANIVHDVGFMDSGLQGSLQLQVIADDTLGFLRAMTRGVVVDDETLALDVVEELGPTGDYLTNPHTLRHFKEPFYSKLADKGTYSQWHERGATAMEERAAQQVDRILRDHKPEPLPPDVQRGIREIVEREQARIEH